MGDTTPEDTRGDLCFHTTTMFQAQGWVDEYKTIYNLYINHDGWGCTLIDIHRLSGLTDLDLHSIVVKIETGTAQNIFMVYCQDDKTSSNVMSGNYLALYNAGNYGLEFSQSWIITILNAKGESHNWLNCQGMGINSILRLDMLQLNVVPPIVTLSMSKNPFSDPTL